MTHGSVERSIPTPDWAPFKLAPKGEHAPPPRSLQSREGVEDRLRSAAFAELQAREAFNWGADHFTDAPDGLRRAWKGLALAEERHLGWLIRRMNELGVKIDERAVSDQLWQSLISCQNARDFAFYMASAEERGRRAGVRFHEAMAKHDPLTSEIFGKIAEEEVEHIRLATRYFPDAPEAHLLAASLH